MSRILRKFADLGGNYNNSRTPNIEATNLGNYLGK